MGFGGGDGTGLWDGPLRVSGVVCPMDLARFGFCPEFYIYFENCSRLA